MKDQRFYEIIVQLAEGLEIWLMIDSGKYTGSVVKALDTKTLIYYGGGDHQYEELKIKFKINGRILWQNIWNLRVTSQTQESIVTKSVDQKKKISKDFLGREFAINDVVFLYSVTYGEILGVINEINDKGSLTIRVAKKKNEGWSDRAKQGIFVVPHFRTCRILIIDDPAILLLRA